MSHFLENLEDNRASYPSRLRSRLLTLLVEGVELRHDYSQIEAIILWRTGFRQVVNIKRIAAHNNMQNLWHPQEDDLLRLLWPSASYETIAAALPGRTLAAINQRASILKLKRPWAKKTTDLARLWTEEDEKLLAKLYIEGLSVTEIAGRLGRSEPSIKGRASVIGVKRPKGLYPRKMEVVWEAENMKVMQESTSPCPLRR